MDRDSQTILKPARGRGRAISGASRFWSIKVLEPFKGLGLSKRFRLFGIATQGDNIFGSTHLSILWATEQIKSCHATCKLVNVYFVTPSVWVTMGVAKCAIQTHLPTF